MFEICIDKIEAILKEFEYKKVSKKFFYKDLGDFIKIIRIRKHTIIYGKFFIDCGIIIKKYRKYNKLRENDWTLSGTVKNITNTNLHLTTEECLNDKIDLSTYLITINNFLDSICDINNLKKMVANRTIYKYCHPMPLGTKTDIEFENYINSYNIEK